MNNQQHQRRRSTETLTLSPILPQDLVVQILLRLPVQSLLRFKSVCKSWRSLISDPEFGKSHYDLAAAPTYRCLTKGNGSEIESLDIDAPIHKDSSVVNFKNPLSSPEYYYRYLEFFGSCRGFILVADDGGDVILWNPSTGFHKKIPVDIQYLHGFGYDASTDDYLLVLVILIPWDCLDEDPVDVANDHPTSIDIFSMKTNSRFSPEGTYAQYWDNVHLAYKVGSLLNDTLHWLVTSYETRLHVIIAFDLVERSLSEIPLSTNLARKLENEEYYYLRVMGECLSLYNLGGRGDMAEIWMMKKYKVQSSWTKVFAFSTCNIPRNLFFPKCFTKHGGIFGSNGSGRFMILNDEGWLLDLCTLWPEPDKYVRLHGDCGIYRESLLSLPNDFEEASKDFEEASEDDQLMSSSEEASEDDQ